MKALAMKVLLIAAMATPLFIAAGCETTGTKPMAGDEMFKKVPAGEHQRYYPKGHGDDLSGKHCFYSEKEGVYFCQY